MITKFTVIIKYYLMIIQTILRIYLTPITFFLMILLKYSKNDIFKLHNKIIFEMKNELYKFSNWNLRIYIYTLDNYDKYFMKKITEMINNINFNYKMFKDSMGYDEIKIIEEEYKLILNDNDNNYINL